MNDDDDKFLFFRNILPPTPDSQIHRRRNRV